MSLSDKKDSVSKIITTYNELIHFCKESDKLSDDLLYELDGFKIEAYDDVDFQSLSTDQLNSLYQDLIDISEVSDYLFSFLKGDTTDQNIKTELNSVLVDSTQSEIDIFTSELVEIISMYCVDNNIPNENNVYVNDVINKLIKVLKSSPYCLKPPKHKYGNLEEDELYKDDQEKNENITIVLSNPDLKDFKKIFEETPFLELTLKNLQNEIRDLNDLINKKTEFIELAPSIKEWEKNLETMYQDLKEVFGEIDKIEGFKPTVDQESLRSKSSLLDMEKVNAKIVEAKKRASQNNVAFTIPQLPKRSLEDTGEQPPQNPLSSNTNTDKTQNSTEQGMDSRSKQIRR